MQRKYEMSKTNNWPVTFPVAIGAISLFLLIGGFGAWSVNTKISGAIIATGKVKVEENQYVLDHLYGGIIKELFVKDGTKVQKDQTLIIFDGMQPMSELAIIEFQLYELIARRNRLEAERDEQKTIKFNTELIEKSQKIVEFKDILNGQKRLFAARLKSFEKEVEKTEEGIIQIKNQIKGKEIQNQSNFVQLNLMTTELKKLKSQLNQGLNLRENVFNKELEEARLTGEINGLKVNISELEGKIIELQIELLRVNAKRREQAIERLRDIKTRENELTEKRNSLIEQINRLEIKAPIDGIIHNMKIIAKNNIVKPSEPILYIVPTNKPLMITSKIDTIDIEQLFIGQNVTIRFSAFDQKTTPELNGFISNISPDALEETNTGALYYKADIETNYEEIEKLGNLLIIPGMPVEVYIKTNERTPLSFLTKPLTDYFYKSFRGS